MKTILRADRSLWGLLAVTYLTVVTIPCATYTNAVEPSVPSGQHHMADVGHHGHATHRHSDEHHDQNPPSMRPPCACGCEGRGPATKGASARLDPTLPLALEKLPVWEVKLGSPDRLIRPIRVPADPPELVPILS